MRLLLLLLFLLTSLFSYSQTVVSAYKFENNLNPYLDTNSPHVLPLEHRTGSHPTQPFSPTEYTFETIGSNTKHAATFNSPQFFRANHGMNANSNGRFVNRYTIVMDVKFNSPVIGTKTSLFNTDSDCRNDGEGFVRWDDDTTGKPVGRLGVGQFYYGTLTPNVWHRLAITVDCTKLAGLSADVTFYVDGVSMITVATDQGFDGRWAALSWDDQDPNGDHIDILGDENGENNSGSIGLLAFYDSVLSAQRLAAIGPVGTLIVGPGNTETLAPTAEAFLLGSTNSGGNVASWAEDDGNLRKTCKFFVPDSSFPYIRIRLFYTTTKRAASIKEINFRLRIANDPGGLQFLTLSIQNKLTNSFILTSVRGETTASNTTYTAKLNGVLADYVDSNGVITGMLEIGSRGFQTASFPCFGLDSAKMIVTD